MKPLDTYRDDPIFSRNFKPYVEITTTTLSRNRCCHAITHFPCCRSPILLILHTSPYILMHYIAFITRKWCSAQLGICLIFFATRNDANWNGLYPVFAESATNDEWTSHLERRKWKDPREDDLCWLTLIWFYVAIIMMIMSVSFDFETE